MNVGKGVSVTGNVAGGSVGGGVLVGVGVKVDVGVKVEPKSYF